MQPISNDVILQALALVQRHGGIRAASRASGIPFSNLQERVARAKERGLSSENPPVVDVEPTIRGRVHALPREKWTLPTKGKVKRYIFTCAQNNTKLHDGVWANLKALAAHYDARICVSTFTYDKASYGQMSVKRGKTAKPEERNRLWYAPEVEPHVLDESVVVAPGLIWCGEMNIIPTAVKPLTGFESYTGRYSGIFPHVKFALNSIPSGKHEGTKLNFTTGTVTQRNYIAKSAGFRAEFHHGYGGLLVEVDSDGTWFCRQLNADSDGVIYDMTARAKDGKVTLGHRVEAITWGDIHVGTVDFEIHDACWESPDSMARVLQPRYQFMHDVLDFHSRNHHARGNPHEMFRRYVEGRDDVLQELKEVAEFLLSTSGSTACQTIVVSSNHDNALTRWLREADYRQDPKNAVFFLEAQLAYYKAIEKHQSFHALRWAAAKFGVGGRVRFLDLDESFVICKDANGGIEGGMHGHVGPDGSKGSLRAFAKMGRKSNTGHAHGAAIEDGAYRAGVTGALDQGYNVGPSSWSHSHIVTYANGKRAIYTLWGGKWHA